MTHCARLAGFVIVIGSIMLTVSAYAADPIPDPSVTVPKQNPIDKRIQKGRDFFQKKKYAEARTEFKAALALRPDHGDARFLAGLAAYWARQPELALDDWNTLLDKAPRDSAEEWELQRHRVLALSALSQDAADTCVERLYELRSEGKVKAAQTARGFAREHLVSGNLRAVVWEVFDERGESEDLWTCPVVNDEKDQQPLKIISVKAALMPGGTPGFALIEEGPGYIRTFQRWAKKPDYAAVRPIVAGAFQCKLKALDEKAADNAGRFGPADAEKPVTERENIAPRIRSLQLSPEASRMVNVAARLREVDFDITRLTRLSLTDPDLAERLVRELKARSPLAQEDAAELVDLLSRAKPEHATEAFASILKLGARKPYLDFVLLTAINTRGSADAPPGLLEVLSQNKDFMVRQTALLMCARTGNPDSLQALVKEAESADATGANILGANLQEVLAAVPAPPAPGAQDDAALKKWRDAIAAWHKGHEKNLKFNPKPKPGQPFWSTE